MDSFNLRKSDNPVPTVFVLIAGAQVEGGGWGGLPGPFSEIGREYPNFRKKCPDCGHLWAKFLI